MPAACVRDYYCCCSCSVYERERESEEAKASGQRKLGCHPARQEIDEQECRFGYLPTTVEPNHTQMLVSQGLREDKTKLWPNGDGRLSGSHPPCQRPAVHS